MNNPELYIKCPECKGHQQINRCRTCDNEWFIEYTAEIKLPEPGTGSKIVQESAKEYARTTPGNNEVEAYIAGYMHCETKLSSAKYEMQTEKCANCDNEFYLNQGGCVCPSCWLDNNIKINGVSCMLYCDDEDGESTCVQMKVGNHHFTIPFGDDKKGAQECLGVLLSLFRLHITNAQTNNLI